MTPNKFAYKAISGVFPRLIYSGTLRRGKALFYQLLLKLFFFSRKTVQYYKQNSRVSLCMDEVM